MNVSARNVSVTLVKRIYRQLLCRDRTCFCKYIVTEERKTEHAKDAKDNRTQQRKKKERNNRAVREKEGARQWKISKMSLWGGQEKPKTKHGSHHRKRPESERRGSSSKFGTSGRKEREPERERSAEEPVPAWLRACVLSTFGTETEGVSRRLKNM